MKLTPRPVLVLLCVSQHLTIFAPFYASYESPRSQNNQIYFPIFRCLPHRSARRTSWWKNSALCGSRVINHREEDFKKGKEGILRRFVSPRLSPHWPRMNSWIGSKEWKAFMLSHSHSMIWWYNRNTQETGVREGGAQYQAAAMYCESSSPKCLRSLA